MRTDALMLARALAKSFEGLSLRVYICPAGWPTIGYGHVTQLSHPAISVEEAERLLDLDLSVAMQGALRYCPGLFTASSGRLAAITDFVFNLGAGRLRASTLRRRVNEEDWNGARKELRRWVRAGARVLPGLVRRREAEINLTWR